MSAPFAASDGTDVTSRRGLAHSAGAVWAVRVLSALSAAALIILLITTFAGVIMRYIFGAPILGGNEIVQLVSVALVMLAMPAAAQQEEHVRVDVFDGYLGDIGRLAANILSRGLAIYLLSLLTLRAWAKLWDAVEYGDATNMIGLPLWPFYGLLALGAALYGVVLALQLIDIVLGRVMRRD